MEKIIARLEAIRSKNINQWEDGFTESLLDQASRDRNLSEKQLQVLSRIEAKHSDEAQAKRNAWQAQWDDDKKKIAKICAHYYYRAGYFTDLARDIIEDKDFIPTEKQYNKMCTNKYAQKVIKATQDEPLFAPGSMVQVRKTPGSGGIAGDYALRRLREKAVLIVAVDAYPVISACKGAKVYKILPVGSSETVLVEERHLKKLKKLKKQSDQIGSQDEILF